MQQGHTDDHLNPKPINLDEVRDRNFEGWPAPLPVLNTAPTTALGPADAALKQQQDERQAQADRLIADPPSATPAIALAGAIAFLALAVHAIVRPKLKTTQQANPYELEPVEPPAP